MTTAESFGAYLALTCALTCLTTKVPRPLVVFCTVLAHQAWSGRNSPTICLLRDDIPP
jgi:hypothetical protein